MKSKDRVVILQKQLSIAMTALVKLRDDGSIVAENAIDKVEHIRYTQGC